MVYQCCRCRETTADMHWYAVTAKCFPFGGLIQIHRHDLFLDTGLVTHVDYDNTDPCTSKAWVGLCHVCVDYLDDVTGFPLDGAPWPPKYKCPYCNANVHTSNAHWVRLQLSGPGRVTSRCFLDSVFAVYKDAFKNPEQHLWIVYCDHCFRHACLEGHFTPQKM